MITLLSNILLKPVLLFYLVSLLLITTYSSNVYAIKTIVVNRGQSDPIPVAINEFSAEGTNAKVLAEDIAKVISNDLSLSGMFRPISQAAFIENIIGIKHKPLFITWRQINAHLLLNAEVVKLSGDKIKVSFILWDTVLEKAISNSSFETSSKLWRRIAHKIADKIYEAVTGNNGYFDTKIAYVEALGSKNSRTSRIAIMDFDGANHRYLTDGRRLVKMPRFSPKGDKILYVSYDEEMHKIQDRKSRKVKVPVMHVHIRDLTTAKDQTLATFQGMAFDPCFSPDGHKALLSVSNKGATNIYEIDLRTKAKKQLTYGSNINTSASYSPDGRKILYNSDTTGATQLYVMDNDGENVKRISFGGGSYRSPVWSPDGKYIAFVKISRGSGFTIGVMRADLMHNNHLQDDMISGDKIVDPNASNERIITSGYILDSISWAPNSKTLLFTNEPPSSAKNSASTSKIYRIDITGYNEYVITTPKNAAQGDWSHSL